MANTNIPMVPKISTVDTLEGVSMAWRKYIYICCNFLKVYLDSEITAIANNKFLIELKIATIYP